MSIETTLKSLINPLVEGGCHNTVNQDLPPVVPYVVFQEIAGVPVNTIHSSDGVITRHRYQVDVFAASPEAAKGLALGTIKSAIASSPLAGTVIFHCAGQYSETDKTFQYITEFTVWA